MSCQAPEIVQSRSRVVATPRLTHAPSTNADALWSQRVIALLTGLLCFRIAYLFIVPLELCPDEAYYWDWSRQWDWGYYSKPPLIAWIIALSTWLGGNSEPMVRMPAAILGTIGLWPVFALGRQLFSARVGFWAVAMMAATPAMAALNLVMTIDSPFLCAWAFAVWCLWELFGSGRTRWEWMPAAVLATGLGLLSKQTMLGLFPLVLLWLACDAAGRRQLRSPAPWLWIAASSLFLVPVLWWNAQHDWVTVQHTREHFEAKSLTLAQHFTRFAEFWITQFGMYSPVLCGLIVSSSLAALASWSYADRRVRFLLWLGAMPLLAVSALSFLQRVQPNWPASFFLTLFILAAARACGEWRAGSISSRSSSPAFSIQRPISPSSLKAGIAVGTVLSLLLYIAPFVLPHTALAGSKFDFTTRLRGWKKLGQEIGSIEETRQMLVIAATSRGPVSALAYYLPGQPHVYRWNPTGIRESQHEIWGGPLGHLGEDAVILTQRDEPIPTELVAAFDTIESREKFTAELGGTRREVLKVWHGTGYRGWPVHAQFRTEH